MSKPISAFLWAWRNYEAGSKSLRSLRRFYPDADLFIQVDYEGDVENYTKIAEQLDATVNRNAFQLGYCGDFGYVTVGRTHWPRTHSFEWLNNLYKACCSTDSKYMIILEEDDFILRPVTLLQQDLSIAIHPTCPSPTGINRPNNIDGRLLEYSKQRGGISEAPGYGAGGGAFVNREHYISAWERCKEELWNDYDTLAGYSHIVGWQDFIVQYVMMLGGYPVIQNPYLAEHWEVGERWDAFEIITGFKNHTLVEI